jgi:hypothetical protein
MAHDVCFFRSDCFLELSISLWYGQGCNSVLAPAEVSAGVTRSVGECHYHLPPKQTDWDISIYRYLAIIYQPLNSNRYLHPSK